MARGAAKQGTAKAKGPITPARRPGTAAKPRPTPGTNDMTMFFPRLRKQAKWVFVFLAVIFSVSFVFLGVGSGSSGITDVLNPSQWFGGGSSGTGQSALGHKAKKHPLDARAQLDYAQSLETDGKNVAALAVLEAFRKQRPTNTDVLNELAALYQTQASNAYTRAQNAQIDSESVSGASLVPALTNKAGTPALGTDPIVDAITSKAQTISTKAQTDAQTALARDVVILKKLVQLSPDDTSQIFNLAETAQAAGDTATATKNYKEYIKQAPDTPQATLAKQRLKQLQTPAANPVVTGG